FSSTAVTNVPNAEQQIKNKSPRGLKLFLDRLADSSISSLVRAASAFLVTRAGYAAFPILSNPSREGDAPPVSVI
ncbi:MAG: hypothetical protein ONB23_06295, partial [candidate division KSB1 bacterium]|nr:hypothetical protein [candidate division KSB1 bacterium]